MFRSGIIVATGIGALCGAIAITGFIIRPPRESKNHSHVFFETNGGPVLFPHMHHSDDNGGAIECAECHHKYDAADKSPQTMKCRACHYDDPDVKETACADSDAHPRCIGKKCNTCHEGESCTFCHRPLR
jgi:hypothetical protein